MSALEEERLVRLAVCRLSEPGDIRTGRLVSEEGPRWAYEVLSGKRVLEGDRAAELASAVADAAPRLVEVKVSDGAALLEKWQARGIRFLIPGDTEWPSQLASLAECGPLNDRGDLPVGLWVRGPLRLDQLDRSVAVVGSRAATSYGEEIAREIGSVLASEGVPVISGAAYGIDQAAHRGAIAVDGPTVAVLACGVDRAYPTAHRNLLDHLARHGAVISEAVPGSSPLKIRFLARNRLIAALSRTTVVVEAALRSGALNTANWAGELNRVVLGVPGPTTSVSSGGVHQLIRSGGAALVTSGREVLETVGASGEHLLELPRGPELPQDRLTLRQRQVLDALPVHTGAGIESLARVAGLGVLEVRAALERLSEAELATRTGEGWRLGSPGRTMLER